LLYFVNQYGWPDGAATGQILCDVLRKAANGSRVVLVQSRVPYSVVAEDRSAPPAEIRRLWAPRLSREKKVPKLVGFLSFYIQTMFMLLTRPTGSDVVVMTTPPFLNWVGAVSKLLRGGRLIAWEMDVYPEILYSTGTVARQGLFGSLLHGLTRWARSNTDLTLVLGPCMGRVIAEGGAPAGSWAELQNWADGSSLFPIRVPGQAASLTLLYSGNLGVAHDVETMADTLARFHGTAVNFVFAGGGVGMTRIRSLQSDVVRLLPACSYGELNAVLNSADIGLVTQTRASLGCVVPSKFYGVLAAGRGVLYVGPEESTVARVIRETGCGWTVELGDSEGMARLIRELEADRTRVQDVGARARQVFEERFTREKGAARFWELLASLDDKRPN
jgi:colanic acid biosynthesis glycosyl transferase WcaI